MYNKLHSAEVYKLVSFDRFMHPLIGTEFCPTETPMLKP